MADFNPSARGRGPGRLGAWYEVKLTSGEAFTGRYMAVDFTDTDRADHILEFDCGDSVEHVRYAHLYSAIRISKLKRRG